MFTPHFSIASTILSGSSPGSTRAPTCYLPFLNAPTRFERVVPHQIRIFLVDAVGNHENLEHSRTVSSTAATAAVAAVAAIIAIASTLGVTETV